MWAQKHTTIITTKLNPAVNKIETDKCEIIYTNDTPHIDTIVQVPDEEQTKNWLTLSWMLSIRTSFSSDKYKIYVPEGTITDDFSIDME